MPVSRTPSPRVNRYDGAHLYRVTERRPNGQTFYYHLPAENRAAAREALAEDGSEVVSVSHATTCPCKAVAR